MRLTFCVRNCISSLKLLRRIKTEGCLYGYGSPEQLAKNSTKTVVVEYSSPNIAKPFHVGHIRSTLLGNFLANIYERCGWNVVRLNYLGDWGTQFGLLAVGFQRYGKEAALESDPIQYLFKIYVRINGDVEKEKTQGKTETQELAMQTFKRMEQGDEEVLKLWRHFADVSRKELTQIYQRLGVAFTDYHSESMYHQPALALIDRFKQDGTLHYDELGRGYVEYEVDGRTERVILLKSDGTTLYITRDIAALMHRAELYKFDKIHYVVETAQENHFHGLCGVMSRLPNWKNRLGSDVHVKFGRIEGMSTRKGSVIFLQELLDEAKAKMTRNLASKKSTKIAEEDFDSVSEKLAQSAIIAMDLGEKRRNNYKFNWDSVLQSKQDSGPFMQYAHARLCSLEKVNSDVLEDDDIEARIQSNPQIENLIEHLQRYESTVELALNTLEPYHIVHYLYKLCHCVNQAYRVCNVKKAEPDIAKGYLLMYSASKVTLANGMTLMGLNPVEKM